MFKIWLFVVEALLILLVERVFRVGFVVLSFLLPKWLREYLHRRISRSVCLLDDAQSECSDLKWLGGESRLPVIIKREEKEEPELYYDSVQLIRER